MSREQYEAHWKDYYQILGVRPDADAETIQRMWRRLSQLYHPDVAGDVAVDPQRMLELNEAREVLSDPRRRASYDQFYGARQTAGSSAARSTATDVSPHEYYGEDVEEPSDVWVSDLANRFPALRVLQSLAVKISPGRPDENQRILPSPRCSRKRHDLPFHRAGDPAYVAAFSGSGGSAER